MPEFSCEFELAVGDAIQIGDHTLTVIDIDGLDVSFRVDDLDSGDLDSEALRSWLSAVK